MKKKPQEKEPFSKFGNAKCRTCLNFGEVCCAYETECSDWDHYEPANPHGFTHYIECTKCRQPAIYLKHKPSPGDPVLASRVFFNSGASPQTGEIARCQYCGFALTFHASTLKEVGHE